MAISDQITAINTAKQAIKTAIEAKGVTVGTTPLSGYAGKIDAIPSAGSTLVEWIRHPDWLPLPTVTATNQKFVGLYAVYFYNNSVALSATGDFTVNWGDGTIQNYTSGTTAEHTYDYNGTALNGTLSTRGYKQAIITLTPQAGQTLTSIDLQIIPSVFVADYIYTTWLDIAVAGPSLTTFKLGVMSYTAGQAYEASYVQSPGMLEQVSIVKSVISDLSYFFAFCTALQSIPSLSHSSTTCEGLFYGCSTLSNVPMIDVSMCTNFYATFAYCKRVIRIPNWNTSNGTNFAKMFSSCEDLLYGPALNTSAGVAFDEMFRSCSSLITVPAYNTTNVTSAEFMFDSCYALIEVPALDFSNAHIFGLMGNYIYCMGLRRFAVIGLRDYVTLSGLPMLNADAINEVFSNLGTASEPDTTIDLTYTPGVAGSNTAIAIAKGWSVLS